MLQTSFLLSALYKVTSLKISCLNSWKGTPFEGISYIVFWYPDKGEGCVEHREMTNLLKQQGLFRQNKEKVWKPSRYSNISYESDIYKCNPVLVMKGPPGNVSCKEVLPMQFIALGRGKLPRTIDSQLWTEPNVRNSLRNISSPWCERSVGFLCI